MSLGLSKAGIRVLGGVDNATHCRKTYEKNIIGAKFIKHDISTLSSPQLARRLALRRNDPHLIFAGCSPCQFWSKIRTDKTKANEPHFSFSNFKSSLVISALASLSSKMFLVCSIRRTKRSYPISFTSLSAPATRGTTE